ncbi:MAG: pyrroline-5-carboxylate reductase [Clostridiales Family XIII bacterium]|jgi:pyrroline-5-carboxylate reductase|nr:pyrroline-5-carboxylate reductase [Clostridiales Family XIII bacterium]
MRIGFIGAGNMGGAIIKGYAAALAGMKAPPDELYAFDADAAKAEALAAGAEGRVALCGSLAALVEASDMVVLAVKPNAMEGVLEGIRDLPGGAGKVFVSIAAGVSIGFLRGFLGAGAQAVRVMPNTPAMVGEGMSALYADAALPQEAREAATRLFGGVGKAVWVADEDLMHIVTGISGSSPAYAYMYMEALIAEGVEGGLTEGQATLLAAQSTLGAAKMVLENAGVVDPVQLRVNVCSPGGTTIEAVHVLEEGGFRETLRRATDACVKKSRLMAK